MTCTDDIGFFILDVVSLTILDLRQVWISSDVICASLPLHVEDPALETLSITVLSTFVSSGCATFLRKQEGKQIVVQRFIGCTWGKTSKLCDPLVCVIMVALRSKNISGRLEDFCFGTSDDIVSTYYEGRT